MKVVQWQQNNLGFFWSCNRWEKVKHWFLTWKKRKNTFFPWSSKQSNSSLNWSNFIMIFKLISPVCFAIVVSEQIPRDCFWSLNPDFPLSFERSSRSLLTFFIQRMLEAHAGREQSYLSAGVRMFSSALFGFSWLPRSIILDGNWTSWAVSKGFSHLICQEATEYKLKQALVGVNQLNRLMIPVRRCEIVYPLNTKPWQVSVFWVTDLMCNSVGFGSVYCSRVEGHALFDLWRTIWFSRMNLGIMLFRVIFSFFFTTTKED